VVPVAVLLDYNVSSAILARQLKTGGAFLLEVFQLRRPAHIHGDTHEKWKKEAGLDICTGS